MKYNKNSTSNEQTHPQSCFWSKQAKVSYSRHDCNFYVYKDAMSPEQFLTFSKVMISRVINEIRKVAQVQNGKSPCFKAPIQVTPNHYSLRLMIPVYLLDAFQGTCVREFVPSSQSDRPSLYLNDSLFSLLPTYHEVFYFGRVNKVSKKLPSSVNNFCLKVGESQQQHCNKM